MTQRNRKIKTVKERYGEYTVSIIKLSEDGIVYEVLLDKYISFMENLFSGKNYKDKTTYNVQMDIFLKELNLKFQSEGKIEDRLAPGCNSYKSFERYFDKAITKKNGPISIEDEKKCIHIIKDMEFFFDTKLLSNPEESLHKKNEYIHSLIQPLIDIMVKSDLFYYIPHTTKALGYQCYWNQMRMIENNIEILFKDENVEIYEMWQEILEPLRKIIGDGKENDSYPGGNFPGTTSKVWLDANPILAYFDCVYDIAEKDYQLYESINEGRYGKVHFNFKIGEDEFEVRENIKKRTSYFRSQKIRDGFEDDFEKEKQVFFLEFRKAYVKIVKQYMHIDSV